MLILGSPDLQRVRAGGCLGLPLAGAQPLLHRLRRPRPAQDRHQPPSHLNTRRSCTKARRGGQRSAAGDGAEAPALLEEARCKPKDHFRGSFALLTLCGPAAQVLVGRDRAHPRRGNARRPRGQDLGSPSVDSGAVAHLIVGPTHALTSLRDRSYILWSGLFMHLDTPSCRWFNIIHHSRRFARRSPSSPPIPSLFVVSL